MSRYGNCEPLSANGANVLRKHPPPVGEEQKWEGPAPVFEDPYGPIPDTDLDTQSQSSCGESDAAYQGSETHQHGPSYRPFQPIGRSYPADVFHEPPRYPLQNNTAEYAKNPQEPLQGEHEYDQDIPRRPSQNGKPSYIPHTSSKIPYRIVSPGSRHVGQPEEHSFQYRDEQHSRRGLAGPCFQNAGQSYIRRLSPSPQRPTLHPSSLPDRESRFDIKVTIPTDYDAPRSQARLSPSYIPDSASRCPRGTIEHDSCRPGESDNTRKEGSRERRPVSAGGSVGSYQRIDITREKIVVGIDAFSQIEISWCEKQGNERIRLSFGGKVENESGE